MSGERAYVICGCNAVYARSIEALPYHARGCFRCECGAELGAWNGIVALRYTRIADPCEHVLHIARRAGGRRRGEMTLRINP